MISKLLPLLSWGLVSLSLPPSAWSQELGPWREDFESHSAGRLITEVEGWTGFRGFPGDVAPVATVAAGKGVGGSHALAVSHGEAFRADGWGLQFPLPQEVGGGVLWIQCKFQPPSDWTGGFFLDARGAERGAILARVAGSPFENERTDGPKLRWHCAWSRPYWRLYTLSELDPDRWYTITTRLDFEARTYAAWIDDQPLGEEVPFSAPGSLTQLHLGFGGTPEDPALVDELAVSREAPGGFTEPRLLPEPEDGILFRFAGIGDPQLGFGGYDTDKVRFGLAVDQVNRAGAELSLVLGDMVHQKDDAKVYEDLASLAAGLDAPACFVRGNHEEMDLFRKYFSEREYYSLVHGGVRFVVIDAIGNQSGLSEEQLAWIEAEFRAASAAGEEIVISLHVSPWQDNERGRGKYNQIGPGRDRLRELMKEHEVLLCLSGHYHRGLWHGEEEKTHYLVLGGTALVKGGALGWCLFDVYPDRIVMHQKPLFFAFENDSAVKIHAFSEWLTYETLREVHPYIQQGPLTMKRHRPAE